MQIALTPKQQQLKHLIEYSDFENLGYGGARGGAKSYAVRSLAVYFAIKYNCQVLIFRRYRDDLLKNHVYPLLRDFPQLRNNFNKSELIIYDNNKNPLIKFDYAESDEDIEKVGQGTEYQIAFIDEATQITQYMIEYISTCVRDPRKLLPSKAKVVLTMNPGGVGHSYVKRVFVDKIYLKNEDGNSFDFIQAHVWDNVFWSATELINQGYTFNDYYNVWTEQQRIDFTIKYSDYAKRLSTLPDELMKAYLWGDWNIFGGMFFKNFSRDLCIKPFDIPLHWRLHGAIDPGWSSTCAFTLTAKDPNGVIYQLFSYGAKETNPVNHARNINEALREFKYTGGRLPDMIVSGLDAWHRRNIHQINPHEITFADIFQEQGLYLNKANVSRIAGWWAWKTLIDENKWFYFNGFNNELEKEMTAVEHDDKDVEDINGKGNDPQVEDHYLDSSRYNIMSQRTPEELAPKPVHLSREFVNTKPRGKTKF